MKVIELYESSQDKITIQKIIESYDKVLLQLEKAHKSIYNEVINELYIDINGYHFNAEMLSNALKMMVNDDGSEAPKWSVEETNNVANQYGIIFDEFNEYDWNYVMNMIYSDYCLILKDNIINYVNMSRKFLNDKDAPKGKALRYFFAMHY